MTGSGSSSNGGSKRGLYSDGNGGQDWRKQLVALAVVALTTFGTATATADNVASDDSVRLCHVLNDGRRTFKETLSDVVNIALSSSRPLDASLTPEQAQQEIARRSALRERLLERLDDLELLNCELGFGSGFGSG